MFLRFNKRKKDDKEHCYFSRSRLSKMEAAFLDLPWEAVRDSVEVKLLPQEGEIFVLARSRGRAAKEGAMRSRRLKKLLSRPYRSFGAKP